MDGNFDPSAVREASAEVIQRVLFACGTVHVYQIPPLTSNKGYNASSWTSLKNPTAQHIFTARLRILENTQTTAGEEESVKTDIALEDPQSGELFAGAPYTTPGVVEQALDSSRFFALTVRGEGGRKAVLGIGFEDRSDAFDFGVCLQEARKYQGQNTSEAVNARSKPLSPANDKKYYALKEGETISVKLGARRSVVRPDKSPVGRSPAGVGSSSAVPPLQPPPSAKDVRAEKRRSQHEILGAQGQQDGRSATALGFDDGEFGEFQ